MIFMDQGGISNKKKLRVENLTRLSSFIGLLSDHRFFLF
jgi:hypothetical protein